MLLKLAFTPALALLAVAPPTPPASGENLPPVCCFGSDPDDCQNTGFIDTIPCAGDDTTYVLDASGSYDPEGAPLSFLWTSCPNSTVDDPTAATTTLRIDTSSSCSLFCGVRLVISDGENLAFCRIFIAVEEVMQPGELCTQTQGGWGTSCNGNNPGCLRDLYFDDLFPNGLVVGDPDGVDGDGASALVLTSSQAVADDLPTGGKPGALLGDVTDPSGKTSAGVFGGQLVAATLNVAFDDAGVGLCTLTGSCDDDIVPGMLGDLVFADGCVADGLVGQSVDQVIAWANCAISGQDLGSCGVPAGVGIADLSDALTKLNEAYVDCGGEGSCLELP